jgi:NAD(P)-dependent dehydrogenase (short-subunit alcohol dehydrogenase family)
MQCTGKVVLVTGAQQGIGRTTAIEFAAAGADVAINWLDDERAAESVADEVRSHGRRALTIRADIANIQQSQAMVGAVERGLGPLDVLINNAGVFPRVPFLEMSESDWDYVLDVNLKGACFCAQAVARAMVAAERPGVVINLTSGAAFRSSPRGVHYVASKGGVLSMTRAMALD